MVLANDGRARQRSAAERLGDTETGSGGHLAQPILDDDVTEYGGAEERHQDVELDRDVTRRGAENERRRRADALGQPDRLEREVAVDFRFADVVCGLVAVRRCGPPRADFRAALIDETCKQ